MRKSARLGKQSPPKETALSTTVPAEVSSDLMETEKPDVKAEEKLQYYAGRDRYADEIEEETPLPASDEYEGLSTFQRKNRRKSLRQDELEEEVFGREASDPDDLDYDGYYEDVRPDDYGMTSRKLSPERMKLVLAFSAFAIIALFVIVFVVPRLIEKSQMA